MGDHFDSVLLQECRRQSCYVGAGIVLVHRVPVFGRRSHHALMTWGRQWPVYHAAVTVQWSSSGMEARCPELVMKEATIFFPTLLARRTLVGGSSLAKHHVADWRFVSGSYWYTHVSSPVTMLKTSLDVPLAKSFSIFCTISLRPPSAQLTANGAPNGCRACEGQGAHAELSAPAPIRCPVVPAARQRSHASFH